MHENNNIQWRDFIFMKNINSHLKTPNKRYKEVFLRHWRTADHCTKKAKCFVLMRHGKMRTRKCVQPTWLMNGLRTAYIRTSELGKAKWVTVVKNAWQKFFKGKVYCRLNDQCAFSLFFCKHWAKKICLLQFYEGY